MDEEWALTPLKDLRAGDLVLIGAEVLFLHARTGNRGLFAVVDEISCLGARRRRFQPRFPSIDRQFYERESFWTLKQPE
jgi:hypothetical protein